MELTCTVNEEVLPQTKFYLDYIDGYLLFKSCLRPALKFFF